MCCDVRFESLSLLLILTYLQDDDKNLSLFSMLDILKERLMKSPKDIAESERDLVNSVKNIKTRVDVCMNEGKVIDAVGKDRENLKVVIHERLTITDKIRRKTLSSLRTQSILLARIVLSVCPMNRGEDSPVLHECPFKNQHDDSIECIFHSIQTLRLQWSHTIPPIKITYTQIFNIDEIIDTMWKLIRDLQNVPIQAEQGNNSDYECESHLQRLNECKNLMAPTLNQSLHKMHQDIVCLHDIEKQFCSAIVGSGSHLSRLEHQTNNILGDTQIAQIDLLDTSKHISKTWPWSGAAMGAVIGGAMGIVLGPPGIVIGGGIGGTVGTSIGKMLKAKHHDSLNRIIHQGAQAASEDDFVAPSNIASLDLSDAKPSMKVPLKRDIVLGFGGCPIR